MYIMPELVNQYSHTYIGQVAGGGAAGANWQFYFPMIPKQDKSNYFEVDIPQIAVYRTGDSAPHDVLFYVADIAQARSSIINNNTTIDSRINLGMIANYDSGSVIGFVTSPAPVVFRMNEFQPGNRFTVTQCALSSQTGNVVVPDVDPVGATTKFIMIWNIKEFTPYKRQRSEVVNDPEPIQSHLNEAIPAINEAE
jgi:hypothetical protein